MRASHVQDYGYGEGDEFLFHSNYITGWLIPSKPFRLAEQFPLERQTFKWTHPRPFHRSAHHHWGAEFTEFDFSSDAPSAPGRAREGVALLILTAFLQGSGRFVNLFSECRPNAVLQFSERVPMHKGRLLETGATATAHCCIVWFEGVSADQASFDWIPPWRGKLERPEDYRAPAPEEVAA